MQKNSPSYEQQGLTEGSSGQIIYYDGQFDDARLNVTLAVSAAQAGAATVNYAEVTNLLKVIASSLRKCRPPPNDSACCCLHLKSHEHRTEAVQKRIADKALFMERI